MAEFGMRTRMETLTRPAMARLTLGCIAPRRETHRPHHQTRQPWQISDCRTT
jgi:hypothetical protein